jgi:hypothetical protein
VAGCSGRQSIERVIGQAVALGIPQKIGGALANEHLHGSWIEAQPGFLPWRDRLVT